MTSPRRGGWVGAAVLAATTYFLIGRLFPQPAQHLQAWRLAAWLASGLVFAAQLGYESFRLRQPPRAAAGHSAAAVALGALGLAVAGMIHSYVATATIRPVWLLALVIWPAVTALPAFLVALAAAAAVARFRN